MSIIWRRTIGLCLPPVLLCALDYTLTLLGQPSEYWAGDYSYVNELSPTVHDLMAYHPLVSVIGMLLWVFVFALLILLLPDTYAMIISIALTYGHTWGASTWILWRFKYGYQCCNALFLFSAVIIGLGIQLSFGHKLAQSQPVSKNIIPNSLRWIIVIILLAIVSYLLLIPRM